MWPGCLTLPREVSIRPDGLLGIEPARELKKLRKGHKRQKDIELNSSSKVLEQISGDMLEIIAEFEPGDAKAYGMKVCRSDDGSRAVLIRYDDKGLEVDGQRGMFNEKDTPLGPFKLKDDEKTLRLNIFLDKAVMEIYVNGRACYSRMFESYNQNDLGVEVFAEDGSATVRSIDSWKIKPIW